MTFTACEEAEQSMSVAPRQPAAGPVDLPLREVAALHVLTPSVRMPLAPGGAMQPRAPHSMAQRLKAHVPQDAPGHHRTSLQSWEMLMKDHIINKNLVGVLLRNEH